MDAVRLDVWLDVSCLFKTRSEAQKACRNGKVDVNGQPARPNRLVRAGDRIEIYRNSRCAVHFFGNTVESIE